MEIFIVPLVFGLVVAVLLAVAASSRRYEAQWKAAAERLQLGFRPGNLFSRPKISGSRGDLTVTIDVSSSSSGSTSSVRTRYRIGFPPLGLNLRMSRQSGLAKAAALFGVSDVEMGDVEFDEAFSIATSDPQQLSVRLSPDTRRLLMNLVTDFRSVKISDDEIRYEKSSIDRDAEVVVSTAERLIDAARTLQGSSVERPPRRPDIPVRKPIPPPPPPVLGPDPFLAPDLEIVSGPRPPAEMVAGPKPPTKEKPGPGRVAQPDSDFTAGEVAADLFARRGLSFQIARSFEQKYRGAGVVWEGEVRGVRTGIGPGDPNRITLLVATVPHELFGTVEVEAVAAVPGRKVPPEGSRVTVRGSLEGIDALSRQIIIGDARLV